MGDHMATFNATSEYAGQRVFYRHYDPGFHTTDFEIEGSGYVEGIFLVERDAYGHLDWADERQRQRLYSYTHMDANATPARYIDASTPAPPPTVRPQAAFPGAPPGPGQVYERMPVYKRPIFILFAALGLFILLSCCGSGLWFLMS